MCDIFDRFFFQLLNCCHQIQAKVQLKISSNFFNFSATKKFFSNFLMAEKFKINGIERFDEI